MREEKAYYTPQEVAEILSVDVMRIYHYIMAGRLKTYKTEGEQRIDKREFQKFLKSLKPD